MEVEKTEVKEFDRVWFVGFRELPSKTQRTIDSVLEKVRGAVGQSGFVGKNHYLHIDPAKLSRAQKPLEKFFEKELKGEELDLYIDSTWKLTLTFSDEPRLPWRAQREAHIEKVPGSGVIDDILWIGKEVWINTSAKPTDAFIASIKKILA